MPKVVTKYICLDCGLEFSGAHASERAEQCEATHSKPVGFGLCVYRESSQYPCDVTIKFSNGVYLQYRHKLGFPTAPEGYRPE